MADQTIYQTNLPEYAKPYVLGLLKDAQGLTAVPYQAYTGERQAQFTPLQQQAFQSAGTMRPSWQQGAGSDIAAQAALGALRTGYSPFSATSMPAYQPTQLGQFTADTAQQYMSPYMRTVTDVAKREAARQSGIQGVQNQAQATGQGAFGGARSAIVEAERQRNLGQQMSDIEARGLQAAYEQAANRFAQEQQLAEQSRQFGAGLGMQAQQLGEQSRQYGAGLGLQGIQTALQGAGQLGQLGGQQFQQGVDVTKLQAQMGTAQQEQVQNMLNQRYQDFLAQQQYPYQQLSFMSDILRGVPLTGTAMQASYQAPPSMLQSLGSLGLGAYGLSKMFAEGGEVGADSDGYFGDENDNSYGAGGSSFGLGGLALYQLGRGEVR